MWVWHKPFSNDCFSPLPIAIFWLFQKSPHWPSMQNFLSPHAPGARIPWLGISMWGSDPSHFVENLCNCTYPFFFFFWWVTHLGVWHFSILCLLLPISFFILLLWGKFLLVFRSYSSVAALYFGVPMWGSELGSSYSAMLTTASYMSAFISKPYCWDYSHSYEVCFRIRNKKPWNLFFLKTTWLFEFPWDCIWILGWIFLFLHKKHFVILIGIGWIHRSS